MAALLGALCLSFPACTNAEKRDQWETKPLLQSKVKLSCDKDGNFKTLTLADVHAVGKIPENVEQNIRTLVDRVQPNLVIFTGDNTICGDEATLRAALDSMVGYIEQKQIPWCHVYGNHDHEGGMSNEQLQPIYQSYTYCVSQRGETDVSGVGNYVLPVYKHDSNEIVSLVWGLDSGAYLSEEDKQTAFSKEKPVYPDKPNSPYDYIKADQIQWYYQTSQLLERHYNRKIPGLMAFHIPLQETYYAWKNRETLPIWTGEKHESVCASVVNSGLFQALVERGDVKAVVNGHDHINDFMVEYNGVKLCYSPGVSTLTYHDVRMMGGRVFTWHQDTPTNIQTHVEYLFRTAE